MKNDFIKNPDPIKSVFDLPTFKDQISFHLNEKEKPFIPTKIDLDLLKGFFDNNTTIQLSSVYNQLIKNNKKNVILELSSYAGKTLISFSLAYYYAHNLGKNAILIYPSKLQRDIAYEFQQKLLYEKYFYKFPNFIKIDSEDDFNTDSLYYPQVYVTDIYSIHKYLMSRITQKFFWEQLQFCVLEDCNNYNEVFGSNSAYVVRRFLSKLDYHNPKYQLLCTTKPINNRIEHISSLTGVTRFDDEVANIDSAKIPGFELYNWYPPIKHIDFKDNRCNSIKIEREKYFDELKNLIQSLLKIDKYIAILWQKYFISSEDIANITLRLVLDDAYTNNIFIGNDFNQIRYKLLKLYQNLDLSDLNSIVIVGTTKPLSFYLSELLHIGAKTRKIFFFDNQSPSLQYQIIDYLKTSGDPNKSILDLTQIDRDIHIDINDNTIIEHHSNYLKDEQPLISGSQLEKYFPKQFRNKILSTSNELKGKYLILNKGLKYFPKTSRNDEQLYESSNNNLFTLILVRNKNTREEIGKMIDTEVRVKCFRHGIYIYNNSKYFVRNVDYKKKVVEVEQIADDLLSATYKISDYYFTEESLSEELFEKLNGRLIIARGTASITERLIGTKTTRDFQTFSFQSTDNSSSFENVQLNYVEFRFPMCLFEPFFPLEENQTQNQEPQDNNTEEVQTETAETEEITEDTEVDNTDNQLQELETTRRNYTSIIPVLHTFSHLFLESTRINNSVAIEELKLHIPTEPKIIEDVGQFCSIYLIDLAGRNFNFLNHISQGEITSQIKLMEQILLQCPCQYGSDTCIRIDYCNIENCGITNTDQRLHKLNTLRFLSSLLDRSQAEIDRFLRWKSFPDERSENSCVSINDTDKLNSMVTLARSILSRKGLIRINNFYKFRFFTINEINQYQWGLLGLTTPGTSEIAFSPGFTENELFETILHEYFHNYQFDNSGRNINPQLMFFDWEDIDNPDSIPYIGLLVIEGAAVWFSIRMMEFFSELNYISQMRNSRVLEYMSGLHLMLDVERKFGYKNTLSLLQKGFDIKDYIDSFLPKFNQEKDLYINEINEDGTTPERIWCLKRKSQLTNINRVTYFLRINQDPRRNILGLQEMLNHTDKKVLHIPETDIQNMAYLLPADYSQDVDVRNVLAREGLLDADGLICEGCHSNCNLFTACVLNGGRRLFREILLLKYPPPSKKKK